MQWRVLADGRGPAARAAILLWWLLLFARQAGASGPDPSRPIKQMRNASWNEAFILTLAVVCISVLEDRQRENSRPLSAVSGTPPLTRPDLTLNRL